jgi:hypothetical protein
MKQRKTKADSLLGLTFNSEDAGGIFPPKRSLTFNNYKTLLEPGQKSWHSD